MRYKKDRIFAAILAGGKATRLGGLAKGNLKITTNTTIIHHLISEITKTGISSIVLSANDPEQFQQYQLPIIPDNFKYFGPIAGIESCLSYFATLAEAVLFLPCDLPNITATEITTLTQTYFTKRQNVYAVTQENPQSLCAIIKTADLPKLQTLINSDIKKITVCWQHLNATTVFFTNAEAFVNINTYQDLIVLT